MAIVEKDGEWLTSTVVELGQVPSSLDRDRLLRDVTDYVEEYVGLELDDFNLSGALEDLMRIIRLHYILLPPRVSLLIKVMVMLEGTGRLLQPDFSLLSSLPNRNSETPHVADPIMASYQTRVSRVDTVVRDLAARYPRIIAIGQTGQV